MANNSQTLAGFDPPVVSTVELSAIVVTRNESAYLGACLEKLAGLPQLIVVDLQSRDASVEIARRYTNTVVSHAAEPIAEFILPDVVDGLRNDWFIRVDPDEVVPPGLLNDIAACIAAYPDAGILEIPFQYYFLGKPLHHTVWGGIRHFPKVLNRSRVVIHKRVHGAFEIRDGFSLRQVPFRGQNAVAHYWVDNYRQFFEKHERYLLLEGKSRYERGQRFTWKQAVIAALKAFYISFLLKQGWRGGWTGWFLSGYYAWYELRSWVALRNYERSLRSG